jgi:hypothetical protein
MQHVMILVNETKHAGKRPFAVQPFAQLLQNDLSFESPFFRHVSCEVNTGCPASACCILKGSLVCYGHCFIL